MASIHKNGPGWRVHYSAGGRKLKSQTFPTVAEAEAWMRDVLPSKTVETIAELVDLWKKEAPTPHREDAAYRLAMLLAERGWSTAANISLADIRSYISACETKRRAGEKSDWRRPLQYLMTVLRWGHQIHGVNIKPQVLAWTPGAAPRRAGARLLSDEQILSIKAEAMSMGPRAEAIIDYLLTYGARPITACRLLVSDLDPVHCMLTIESAKHSGGWQHAVSEEHVAQWMNLHPKECSQSAPLFPHYKEDRAWKIKGGSAGELSNWYKNTIGKRLKLGNLDGIYHLKRYAITRLLRLTGEPATVASFTGHRDLEQVMTYARTNEERQREVIARLVPKSVPGS